MIKKYTRRQEVDTYGDFIGFFGTELIEVSHPTQNYTNVHTVSDFCTMWCDYEDCCNDDLPTDDPLLLSIYKDFETMGGYYDAMEYCLERIEKNYLVFYETNKYDDPYLLILEVA